MWWTALIPFAAQAVLILVDEYVFHIRRDLPKWERIGHPLDTLTVLLCMGYVLWVPFSKTALIFYALLAIFSSLFVTKDEFVHKEHCPAAEQWLHAVLFTFHPIVLATAGFIWPVVQGMDVTPWIANWLDNAIALKMFLFGQFAMMSCFFLYQILYWNFIRDQQRIL